MRKLALILAALLALPAAARSGDLSLGFGYPYVSAKLDFKALAAEARYAAGSGIEVYSARGYWKFHRGEALTGFTGLEAGYINFKTMGLRGTGYEGAVFIGGQYRLADNLYLLMDFAPTMILLRHAVYTDVSVAGMEYVVNAAVYYRFGPSPGRKDRKPAAAKASSPEELLKQLGSPDMETRRRAAFELGKVAYEDASKPLIKLLADREEKVRGVAALALGRLNDDDAVTPLIGLLEDKVPYVRESAAKALGALREPRAVAALEPLLGDKDHKVRAAAAEALEKMGWQPAPGAAARPAKTVKKKKKAAR